MTGKPLRIALGIIIALWVTAGIVLHPRHVPAPVPRGPEPPPGTVAGANGEWIEDAARAEALGKQTGRARFLLFTGSDWCDWCKMMQREVYSKPEWKDFASRHLVLLMLDYPKHHPQPKPIEEQNKALLDRFKIEGYPTMVMLAPDGHELGRLTTNLVIDEYLAEIRGLLP